MNVLVEFKVLGCIFVGVEALQELAEAYSPPPLVSHTLRTSYYIGTW